VPLDARMVDVIADHGQQIDRPVFPALTGPAQGRGRRVAVTKRPPRLLYR
jgi:hypothetical protein